MAFLECNYHSDVLGMDRTMAAILPQRTMRNMTLDGVDGSGDYAVLYLLHGLSDNYLSWMQQTSICRYASRLPLVIIMPEVNRSFYCDMNLGYRYFTHLAEELPRICKNFFPISTKREHTFVAGLSMGGYGAFKLALRCPGRYAAAASMSGCLDLRGANHEWESVPGERELVFGSIEDFDGSNNDLVHLADELVKGGQPQPDMYACCGTEDYLLETCRSFVKEAGDLGLNLEYEEDPGEHNWHYWDKKIRRVLDWLPLDLG